LRVVIFVPMVTALAAFVLLVVLGMAGLADPRLAAAAFGIAVLAASAHQIAGALGADWASPEWTPPPAARPVRAGRLSYLGSGLLLGSWGALLIGIGRVPLPARLVALAGMAVGLALALVGVSYDRRRAEAARRVPDAEPSSSGRTKRCT
jgi:hypothetical protein